MRVDGQRGLRHRAGPRGQPIRTRKEGPLEPLQGAFAGFGDVMPAIMRSFGQDAVKVALPHPGGIGDQAGYLKPALLTEPIDRRPGQPHISGGLADAQMALRTDGGLLQPRRYR